MKSLFETKLERFCSFELLESIYTEFVSPTLPPTEIFDSTMLHTSFKDKVLFIRPRQQLIPLAPPASKI